MRKEEEEKKERVTFMTIFAADHLSSYLTLPDMALNLSCATEKPSFVRVIARYVL